MSWFVHFIPSLTTDLVRRILRRRGRCCCCCCCCPSSLRVNSLSVTSDDSRSLSADCEMEPPLSRPQSIAAVLRIYDTLLRQFQRRRRRSNRVHVSLECTTKFSPLHARNGRHVLPPRTLYDVVLRGGGRCCLNCFGFGRMNTTRRLNRQYSADTD